ncbi:MAG: RDD family protein, partial [Desulfotomaculales bacterium]
MLLKRFLAYFIDVFLSGIIGLVPVLGGIAATVYMLVRDGLFNGQSVGKRVVGLKVEKDGCPAAFADSVKRNLILAVPDVLLIIPVAGFVLYAVAISIVTIIETLFVLLNGWRLGDKFAGTQVVEGK